MTEQEWKAELADAIETTGVLWQVFAAGCTQNSSILYAHVDDAETRQYRAIRISMDTFPTVDARKAEIVRQLNATPRL